jgi:hypothetical protein
VVASRIHASTEYFQSGRDDLFTTANVPNTRALNSLTLGLLANKKQRRDTDTVNSPQSHNRGELYAALVC